MIVFVLYVFSLLIVQGIVDLLISALGLGQARKASGVAYCKAQCHLPFPCFINACWYSEEGDSLADADVRLLEYYYPSVGRTLH